MTPVVKADPSGAASFAWTVPAAMAEGDFYLKATTLTGKVFGLSPVVTVASKPRRRLFGPSHEFHD